MALQGFDGAGEVRQAGEGAQVQRYQLALAAAVQAGDDDQRVARRVRRAAVELGDGAAVGRGAQRVADREHIAGRHDVSGLGRGLGLRARRLACDGALANASAGVGGLHGAEVQHGLLVEQQAAPALELQRSRSLGARAADFDAALGRRPFGPAQLVGRAAGEGADDELALALGDQLPAVIAHQQGRLRRFAEQEDILEVRLHATGRVWKPHALAPMQHADIVVAQAHEAVVGIELQAAALLDQLQCERAAAGGDVLGSGWQCADEAQGSRRPGEQALQQQ